MGKLKIAKEEGAKEVKEGAKAPAVATASTKKRYDTGILYVQSTYNNTKLLLTDPRGNSLAWSTSGAIGFRGAKKGTPFAAAKIGETLAIKASALGIKEVAVVVKGVGSGRESSIRGLFQKESTSQTLKM